ncbi:MAG: hypothetical protein DHS20C12_13230 [Pseudohongiella sp.]|nr:MAG: hypothetical protein DHS20C12_13230 [Pseudohongiella sp.]
MKFKSLVTLVLTICLAVLTSNAMAKGKKGGKSDKSYKHSEKSEKSRKSEKSGKSEKSRKSRKSRKNGNGYGHCKSDKSGRGHGKKRGRGHNRDCDDDNEEPPVLVCLADVEETIRREDIFDAETGEYSSGAAVSITYQGQVCNIGDEDYADITLMNDDGSYSICSLDFIGSSSSLSNRQEDETNYWYEMESHMACSLSN